MLPVPQTKRNSLFVGFAKIDRRRNPIFGISTPLSRPLHLRDEKTTREIVKLA